MKKIKISELPLCSSLKGLYTIGTDNANRSVKVGLEFVETSVTDAVAKAEAATTAANTATDNAKTATSEAQTATTAANNAATAATTAQKNAETATTNATAATQAAKEATTASETATANANTATANAKEATAAATSAASSANTAATTANTAASYAETTAETAAEKVTKQMAELMGQLIPTGLTVEPVGRITKGNLAERYVKAALLPEGVRQNIFFISDNKAVTVSPQGRLSVIATGRSVVQVIPTLNTSLGQEIEVVVGDPTLRMTTKTSMRFASAGGMRLN